MELPLFSIDEFPTSAKQKARDPTQDEELTGRLEFAFSMPMNHGNVAMDWSAGFEGSVGLSDIEYSTNEDINLHNWMPLLGLDVMDSFSQFGNAGQDPVHFDQYPSAPGYGESFSNADSTLIVPDRIIMDNNANILYSSVNQCPNYHRSTGWEPNNPDHVSSEVAKKLVIDGGLYSTSHTNTVYSGPNTPSQGSAETDSPHIIKSKHVRCKSARWPPKKPRGTPTPRRENRISIPLGKGKDPSAALITKNPRCVTCWAQKKSVCSILSLYSK
jgi:hypothetical protein